LHYMSPEQVEGREADQRSDIFSLGTILYEMATGQRSFGGKSAAGVMAAILEREPPSMSEREGSVSPLLEHLVKRCLAKDPNERWQSAGDVMRELKWPPWPKGRATEPVKISVRTRWPERFAWMAALLALTAIAVFGTRMATRRPPP